MYIREGGNKDQDTDDSSDEDDNDEYTENKKTWKKAKPMPESKRLDEEPNKHK